MQVRHGIMLSGPAGGVLAVEAVLRLAGVPLGIGFDMGGTSTDVSLVEPGRLARLRENAKGLGRPRAAYEIAERALELARS